MRNFVRTPQALSISGPGSLNRVRRPPGLPKEVGNLFERIGDGFAWKLHLEMGKHFMKLIESGRIRQNPTGSDTTESPAL